MRKTPWMVPLIVWMAICLALPAMAENLAANGDFSQTNAAGLPSGGWYPDMWYTQSGVSILSAEEGENGACVRVQNLSENDARFALDVAVEPDTLYRISASVRAEGCPEDGIGATLSVKDTFCYSASLYDTQGEWKTLEFYGKTGADQTRLTLFLRVGGYSALTTGTAWFDDIVMEAIDAAPAGALVNDFTPITASAQADTDDAAEDAEPGRVTPTYLLLAAIYALIVLAVTRRAKRGPEPSGNASLRAFALVLFGAFALRMVMAALVRGYNTDVKCFTAWSERIFSGGLTRFYSDDYFCDYPPGAMLMLWPAALLRRILGVAAYSNGHVMLIKLLAIFCDLGLAVLTYRTVNRRAGNRAALLLGAFVALNPAMMVDSAAWGQLDSVFTLLLALCALYAVERRYPASLACFAGAALVKPQALLFAPLGLFAIFVNILRSDNRKKELRTLGVGVLAALGLMYLAAFPFCVAKASGFWDAIAYPVRWLISLYGNTMSGYDYITINALNLYELMGLNWVSTATVPGWSLLAWILFALSYVYAFLLYWKSKSPRRLFLCGGILIALIFTFGPMIHERYVFPAVILLALAYGVDRDRRLLFSMATLTVTLALNQVLVLQGGMTEANFGHLQSSEQWLNSLLSLINVANALLLAWTGLDIIWLGHIHPLSQPEAGTAEPAEDSALDADGYRLNLKRRDWIAIVSVTLAYAVMAFTNLGSLSAPESGWTSTAQDESIVFDLGQTRTFRMTYFGGICNTTFTVELSYDGETWTEPCYAQYDQGEIFRWLWYVPMNEDLERIYGDNTLWGENGGGSEGNFGALSDDGVHIQYATASEANPLQTARYVRITSRSAGLILYEVGFLDADGNVLEASIFEHTGGTEGLTQDAGALLDEQDTVAAYPSYDNSTYFDEIYHARTAFEHLHGLSTYEWTHPPLGKVLMMVGVWIFGMCPFGWRFMGALMGVLMLPVMYLLVKQLTGNSRMSLIALLLLALDSMHFTLTRIATIDSYAVFFILLMYLFMIRYAKMHWSRQPFCRTLVPLGLCGVTMGCAWATKWTGIYASAGLAVILFWTLIRRYRETKRPEHSNGFDLALVCFLAAWLALIGAAACWLLGAAKLSESSLVDLLPASLAAQSPGAWFAAMVLALLVAIACAAIFAGILRRESAPRQIFWKNTAITIAFCVAFFVIIPLMIYYFSYFWQLQYEGGLSLSRVVSLQKRMFNYHAGLGGDTHYFRSDWYEWPIIWWPMWFYSGSGYLADGMISSISCMGNPAVWWFGLFSLVYVTLRACWMRRCSRRDMLLILGFASQYLPWVLVPRSTFIYHYFASVPFLIATSAALTEDWRRWWALRPLKGKRLANAATIALCGLMLALCAALMIAGAKKYLPFLCGIVIVAVLMGRGMCFLLKGRLSMVQCTLLSAALLLFVAFYPLESGMPVARSYAECLRWFKWYNY